MVFEIEDYETKIHKENKIVDFAVVTGTAEMKKIPPNSFVMGNPCIIKRQMTEEEIKEIREIA